MKEGQSDDVVAKLARLLLASQEFFADEGKYSRKADLLELCRKHVVTPQELCVFIEKTDIEHEHTDAIDLYSDSVDPRQVSGYPEDYLEPEEYLEYDGGDPPGQSWFTI